MVVAMLNHDAMRRAKSAAGYNMIVVSETGLSAREIYTMDRHRKSQVVC